MKPLALLFILILATNTGAQHLIDRNRPEFLALPYSELTRRIFSGEKDMIAELKDYHPVVETYLQSLWPGTHTQSPIDDAYILTTVDFARMLNGSGKARRGYQKFIIGGESNKVRVINGRRWQLNPNGYLDMLFVDIEDFDADTYRLTYLKREVLGYIQCLVFSVDPKTPDEPGRFKGQLWVDNSSLKIVRVKGRFSSGHMSRSKRILGGNIPIYLSFDSWREEVKPGVWLPRYTYFDDDRPAGGSHGNLEISFHWRGQTFIWGYADDDDPKEDAVVSSAESLTIGWLEHRKLLAKAGPVEQRLNLIVSQILINNKLDVPDLSCRVLMTTPIEIFNINHTIIISRGLLNILPNDSVLAVMLAHQVADILLGVAEVGSQSILNVPFSPTSVRPSNEFANFSDLNTNAWRLAASFMAGATQKDSMKETTTFIDQLSGSGGQVPNLLRPRFGQRLANMAKSLPEIVPSKLSPTIREPLILRGNYVIDAWNDTLELTANTSAITSQIDVDRATDTP